MLFKQFSILYRYILLINNFSGHPKIKELNMMHARDYSNMSVEQVNRNLKSSKEKDAAIAKSMQYVFDVL